MIFDRSRYCKCNSCPLEERTRVWGRGPKNSKIMLISDSPSKIDSVKNELFSGGEGRILNKALGSVGIFKEKIWVTSCLTCRPTNNSVSSSDGLEALRICKKGLKAEINQFKKFGGKVIIPVGNTAIKALNINESITKVRGSVYEYDGLPVIPTFHPSYIMAGNWKEEITWLNDLDKAIKIVIRGYKKQKEKFNIYPKVEEIEQFIERAVKEKSLIAVDIETTGFNLDYAKIIVIGLAINGEEAISVPFYCKGMDKYFINSEEKRVRNSLKVLFAKCPTMFQNALFDVMFLRRDGFDVKNIKEDTLILHHSFHPELPHNLGYITSIYGRTPYWKGPVLNSIGSMDKIKDKELRRYNLRDCIVLHQVLPEMKKDLKEIGTEKVYTDISMKLIGPIIEMMETGIKISDKKLTSWKRSLKTQLTKCDNKIRELSGIPNEFNIDSDEDLRYLLFGVYPSKYNRAMEQLRVYKNNTVSKPLHLKKTTKKYKNLKSTQAIFEGTKPLLNEKYGRIKTASGKLSISEDALISTSKAIKLRKNAIINLKRKSKKTEKEYETLERTEQVITLFLKHKELSKLISTYTHFKIRKDGRVHPQYTIFGTHTGRLSSKSPNAQNIPEEARKIFVAEEGNVIIQADYINLELMVLARESEDNVLQEIFDNGGNAHDENTKLMFGIDKNDPMWEPARKAAKIYIFGRNYGGSIRGIYSRVVKEVPELNLTENQFTQVDRAYRKAHPKYNTWYEETKKYVVRNKQLYNAFGRTRIFLGTSKEIERAGLNFPIQSAAADILSKGLISFYEDKEREKLKIKLIGTVHDSIMIECPAPNKIKAAKLLKKHMEQEHNFRGKMVKFPVEITAGTSWDKKNQKELKV